MSGFKPPPQKGMFRIPSLTGAGYARMAFGWGVIGFAIIVVSLFNYRHWEWNWVFTFGMACFFLVLSVYDFRVFLRISQLRVETPQDELPVVPMRTALRWVLVNVLFLVLALAFGYLSAVTS